MKRAAKCRKCGCTDKKACIEFDAEGRGFACGWATADVCSACVRGVAHLGEHPARNTHVVAPQLAGMVARPR